MNSKRVLIVDDEKNILTSLQGSLEDEGFISMAAESGTAAMRLMLKQPPDVVLLDIWMPDEDGIQVLEKIKKNYPQVDVVMMSGHGTIETAVKAIKLGAFDYLEKPLHIEKLLILLRHVFELKELKTENRYLRQELEDEEALIGKSPAMEHLQDLIRLTAPSSGWVLIQGENGVGKELVARSLHQGSPRTHGRFVAVNCAAIPDELIESELFGHEKGSFTGAHEKKIGKFEQADKGTLFLDEIGDMSPKMQAKILRALEEASITRVGGDRPIEVNTRVIAATNKDLKKGIKEGTFREDLFYRLNVIPLRVPALRERTMDVPALVGHFVRRYAAGRDIQIPENTMKRLCQYSWPGNVRELKNWVERACILSQSDKVEAEVGSEPMNEFSDGPTSLKTARLAFEKEFIEKALEQTEGNISKAAALIGVERSHFHKKLKSFRIETPHGN